MTLRYSILYHLRFRFLIFFEFLLAVYKCFAVSLSVSLCASKNLIQGLQHFIGACCLVFQTLAHPLDSCNARQTHFARNSIYFSFHSQSFCYVNRLRETDTATDANGWCRPSFPLLSPSLSLYFFLRVKSVPGEGEAYCSFGSSLFADYNDATYCFYYTLICVRCWSEFNVGFPQSTYTKLEYHKWTTERILCIFVSQFYRIKADWAVSIKLIVIALFRNWK